MRVLVIWSLGVVAGASGMYWVNTMPTLQGDTVSEAVRPIETVQAKEVVEDNIDELADIIWLNESTRGKNNYSKCEAIGKYNGIGYAIPGDGSFVCFDSHDDEMRALEGWLVSKRAGGMSDDEMLCLYSGNNYVNCKK